MFLNSNELQQLTGYRPNQRKRICAWLRGKKIPFQVNRLGEPVVLRSDVESSQHGGAAPNLEWLNAS